MTDAAIATAIPEPTSQVTASRAILWVAYQIVAIAILGVIVFEILGWPIQATPVEIAAAISLLPQLITTFNLIRAGRPAPPLMLWLALVIVCAIALGLGLWAATRASVEATIIGVVSFAWAHSLPRDMAWRLAVDRAPPLDRSSHQRHIGELRCHRRQLVCPRSRTAFLASVAVGRAGDPRIGHCTAATRITNPSVRGRTPASETGGPA